MRLVSLAPSNTEIIYRLEAENQLVGTTNLCDHPKDAKSKSKVGGWINPDIQQVKYLEPDLVIASDDLQDRAVKKLEQGGLNVLQVKPHSLEELFGSILKIGGVIGKSGEAEKLVYNMKSEIESVNLNGKRIYCEEWLNPPMVSGNWVPELIEEANGEYFIEEGRSREFRISDLKEFNPEYIFLNICGAGTDIETEKLTKRKGWNEIEAVNKNRIHGIDDALLNRPGPRIIKGLKEIEKTVS